MTDQTTTPPPFHGYGYENGSPIAGLKYGEDGNLVQGDPYWFMRPENQFQYTPPSAEPAPGGDAGDAAPPVAGGGVDTGGDVVRPPSYAGIPDQLWNWMVQEGFDPENPTAFTPSSSPPSMDSFFNGVAFADGGQVKSGLPSAAEVSAAMKKHRGKKPRHIKGSGDGRSDDVKVNVSVDEFVWPADVVAAIGNGSSTAGGKRLSEMAQNIRAGFMSELAQRPPPAA